VTAPVLDASGARITSGGYDEFDGFLWLVAGRDFRDYFVFADDANMVLRWPPGKLALLIGVKGEIRWDFTFPNVTTAALHVPASEVAKVVEGAPWDLIFEHKGGSTEVVAEGFCRIQDGCGGKSAPLLTPAVLPPPISTKF
jgi:hypothetical protein